MRSEFIKTLTQLAEQDERIVLLTGDLGYTVLEPFIERFPRRFFNVGVAEQNMIGVATGLAEAKFIPFVYSIVNFAVVRPYEFIRNGPILHHLPVRIVGVGGGFEYGPAGMSHFGLEDIGLMRLQKGITTVIPCDIRQTKNALNQTWNRPGPVYYRIAKGDKNFSAGLEGKFEIGRVSFIKKGKDLVFITLGSVTKEVCQAADLLASQNISAAVMAVSSFNPGPDEDIKKALRNFHLAVTVEDHYTTGGLGSYVAEIRAQHPFPCQIIRCGIHASCDGIVGSREYMLQKNNLCAKSLAQLAKQKIRLKR